MARASWYRFALSVSWREELDAFAALFGILTGRSEAHVFGVFLHGVGWLFQCFIQCSEIVVSIDAGFCVHLERFLVFHERFLQFVDLLIRSAQVHVGRRVVVKAQCSLVRNDCTGRIILRGLLVDCILEQWSGFENLCLLYALRVCSFAWVQAAASL